MNYIKDTLDYLSKLFQWWIIISPWEKGIRVRFGNRVKLLEAGIHFRIPFFDTIYMQTIRSRNVSLPVQTLTSKDGITLTINSVVSYSIIDIIKLYDTLYHPEMTIANIVMSKIAVYISDNNIKDCSPAKLNEEINKTLSNTDYGVKFENMNIVSYAIVKTYRLIQEGSWIGEGYNLNDKK